MIRFRRYLALLLLATFAGVQSAAARCVKDEAVDVAGQTAPSRVEHGRHASGAVASGLRADHAERGGVPQGHDAHPLDCNLMLACSAVAPSAVAASIACGPLMPDVDALTLTLACESAAVPFDPPPPRPYPV